jgi:drug/metabolite transporter (DMT)-like permease
MRYVPALLLDAVFVLVFAAIGRASHDENPAGFLLTAWPFLVALVVGHLVAALLPRRPRRPWGLAWGAVVWVVTVAGGMLLRVVSGDTAQLPFVIVATITLGVLLIGWRAAAALMRRRRADRAAAGHPPVTDEAGLDQEAGLDRESGADDEPGSAADHRR